MHEGADATRPCAGGLTLLFVPLSVVLGQPAAWTAEVIWEGSWPAAVVDDSLRIHVYYSDPATTLVHGCRDNAGWHVSDVDQPTDGEIWWKSMGSDDDGALHVAYHGGMNAPYSFVGYACGDAIGWQSEHFQTLYYPLRPSLAVDADHIPPIVYTLIMGTRVLRHAWKTSSGLQFETIMALSANTPDIAVDDSGQVHVAYSEDENDEESLMYAAKGASGWAFEGVDTDIYLPGLLVPSLALDAAGHPHISYTKNADHGLRDASKASGSWVIETVGSVGSEEYLSSLCIDDAGTPRIAYCDATAGTLLYACKTPAEWVNLTVDSSSSAGCDLCLTFDPDGNPHIACDDATNVVVGLARAGLPLTVTDYVSFYDLARSPAAGTASLWIYGAVNATYFVPGRAPPYEYRIAVLGAAVSTWSTTMGMGDEDNYTYRVVAVDVNNAEIGRSRPGGEFDFPTQLP